MKLSPALVRASLASHSALGLSAALLLYVLCASGTLAVLYLELERWERPAAPETGQVTPEAVQRAAVAGLEAARAGGGETPEHLYVNLPTPEVPRLVVTAGETGRFATPEGELAGDAGHAWTHFLVAMHYALNLPTRVGLPIVGVLGVLFAALIVSGVLAHPSLFRDAFALRMGGSERLRQVDLHNRLGVWTAPFQLVIALTGALIGLASILLLVVATLFFGGDRERLTAPLFGAEPEKNAAAAPLADVGAALTAVRRRAPDERPFYVTVHDPGTRGQVVDVGTQVPRRVVWAERYRFDADGRFVDRIGWSDGTAGAQIYASTFRLHFGHFGGWPVKLAYLVFGLAACVSCISGVNIWLVKRRRRGAPSPRTERAWTAITWGVPLGLAVSAAGSVALGVPGAPVFWLLLPALVVAAIATGSRAGWSRGLRLAAALACAAVPLAHAASFGAAALGPGGVTVNLVWLLLAGALGASLVRSARGDIRRADGRWRPDGRLEHGSRQV